MRTLCVVLAASLVAGVAAPAIGGTPPPASPFGADMTLEQVEAHVVRVLDDGAGRDLTDIETFEDRKPASLLAAGDDGSVWMTSSGGFIRIGTPGEVPDPLDTFLAQMEIGPDGALWIADRQPYGQAVGRWHEGAWTIHEVPAGAWVVWLAARDDGGLDIAWRDAAALTFGVLQPGDERPTTSRLPPLPLASSDGPVVVQRTTDGRLWVAESPWWQREQRFEPAPLWVFDGSQWQGVTPPGDLPLQPRALTVERPGTLRVTWVEVVGTSRLEPGPLTRLAGDGDWAVISVVEQGADESDGLCRGYYEIDGEVLTRYLDGVCLRPAAITPAGDVWVFGHDRDRTDPGVYVITPDR